MKILLTGAGGFIGQALYTLLVQNGHSVIACARSVKREVSGLLPCPDLVADEYWDPYLEGVDVVIHLAARAHVLREKSKNPIKSFRDTNVKGTVQLARHAINQGVRRFIFISSIGVNGDQTEDKPFSHDDLAKPGSPYAISKYEAEEALLKISRNSGLELVIVRPPLVYGPGAPGNFGILIKAVARGIVFPFGSVDNKRSFVALENLTDLISTCIDHPEAANQTFLVSDGEDLSTPDLLCRLGLALGKPVRLFPVPVSLINTAASLIGKQAVAQRLCGSLQVDISKTRTLLGWEPPVSVDEALRKTATHFLKEQGR